MKLARVLSAFGHGAPLAILALGAAPVLAADPATVDKTDIMQDIVVSDDSGVIGYNLASAETRSGMGLATKVSTGSPPAIASGDGYNTRLLRLELNRPNKEPSGLGSLFYEQLARTRVSIGRHRIRVQLTIGF